MTACPTHPAAEAVGACARCGRFFCAAEERALDGQRYCGECGQRPDVDWLGAHYAPLIGKRSGFAWATGLIALGLGAVAAWVLSVMQRGSERTLLALGLLLFSAALFAFFSGARLGRVAPLVAAPLSGVCFGLMSSEWLLTSVASTLVLLLYGFAGWTDVRSKLFFSVPVDRPALHKHFKLYGNNPLAVTASRVAILSLFVPGVGVVALVLAVIALARVDRRATPPVTNVGTALGALLFGLLTTLFWVAAGLS